MKSFRFMNVLPFIPDSLNHKTNPEIILNPSVGISQTPYVPMYQPLTSVINPHARTYSYEERFTPLRVKPSTPLIQTTPNIVKISPFSETSYKPVNLYSSAKLFYPSQSGVSRRTLNTSRRRSGYYNPSMKIKSSRMRAVTPPVYLHSNPLDYNYVKNADTNIIYQNTLSEPPEVLNLNEYKIINEIGYGTYGKIYCAQWLPNGQLYALKKAIIYEAEILNRTIEKNKLLTNIYKMPNSEGIVRVYNYSYMQEGNYFRYYEVMELADLDLEKELKERSQNSRFYSEFELYNLMTQLVRAFALLQKNNITHRDIKPRNILIKNGIYKVCDFGEAKIISSSGGVYSKVRGTELFLSPLLFQRLRSRAGIAIHNTYKSDVFSLGMCFLFAATLDINTLNSIRELTDSFIVKEAVLRYLFGRYSYKIIDILNKMLEIEESDRPDFIQLENMFFN